MGNVLKKVVDDNIYTNFLYTTVVVFAMVWGLFRWVNERAYSSLAIACIFGWVTYALRRANKRASDARKIAEDALRVRDEFLAVASHELKSPMAAVSMATVLLRRDLEGRAAIKKLESIDRQIHRMGKLVDSLMDVTRMSNGQLDYHFEELNLAESVNECVEDSRTANPEQLVFVTVTNQEIIVWADRVRLCQAITNLLNNAYKYGNGKPIEVAVYDTHELAKIVVKDSGRGIAKSEQDRLFMRFQRMSKDVPGLGLGLWIAKQIANAHHGQVVVESEEGKGSAFSIILPLSNPQYNSPFQGMDMAIDSRAE